MGAVASRRRALRSEAMSSVAAKVRAARAFGEYLSQSHPENRNGADHLLADAYSGHDGSPEMQPAPQNKRRLSLISNGRYEGSLPEEAVRGKPTDDVPIRTWFPKENLFSFQTATTTMQAVFRGYAERKRRKRENDSASVIQRNFRKHLRMVGSRRVKAQTFAERRERSFSRSWSDPTPMKADTSHDSRDSGDLQSSHCTLGEAFEDLDWETEKGLEAVACDTEGFVPPKVMLISSKVPKAEYLPTIIRRDDPSIIPILYDHEHATFEDILGTCPQPGGGSWGGAADKRWGPRGSAHTLSSPEEIEKKLNVYHKGAKIWKLLIFCQGGPGHLYLLKNKVATFAKVEKEEDMIHFWKRLSRLMSKVNPEPNVIHVMGCYILGNPNGEKLFQNLRSLMTPYRVTFESPLELSAQGKQMIETYFDFRLYRLWKSRQHSKLLDFEDVL
ncbi:NMDA receptor synaptonuclear signaling and neuronal migration factor isoform X11 [Sus scrofa]|uniref:NMDA receptor synaptonuclear signaling and neuronal migration factor isoform X11 n=1 Tax=Sus scrofa TaxID=9823 RepID=UPI000A2B70FB|nr:NMDA receptor synaptonuclear signaling and neuronal migration factor isoform X11 [Sus scrofa]